VQVGAEISVLQELCDETERLLDGDTANQAYYMGAVPLCNLLHHVNLIQKILPLI